jgi:hypothetical protein
LENVEKSKFFLELIKEQAAQAHTSVIGNKQDLDTAMKPEQIEKILGLKTYSMIAKDPGNRTKMITIIADILEMSAEVSPLLQPLLERDNYTERAVEALEAARFEEAAGYFEKISDLCIELGDDSLSKEFYEKSQKIKTMIQQASTAQTHPVQESAPTETVKPKEASPKPKEAPPKPKEAPPKPKEAPPKPKEAPPKPKEAPPKPKEAPPKPKEAPPKPKETSPKPKEDASMAGPPKTLKPPMQSSPRAENLTKTILPKAAPHPSGPSIKVDPAEPKKTPQDDSKSIEEESLIKPADEALIEPKIQANNPGLNLKPEDFMIKQRPKTVTEVPKDAKNKLKTSPFGHVSNPEELNKHTPVKPAKLVKANAPSGFVPPSISKKPKTREKSAISPVPSSSTPQIKSEASITTKEPTIGQDSKLTPPIPKKKETSSVQSDSKVVDPQKRAELENSLIDLRIKRAGTTKMSLDFDMKELTGEITSEELAEKKKKLKLIEVNIDQQIKELEELLGK